MIPITIRRAPGNDEAYRKMENLEAITRRCIRHAWFGFGKDLKDVANKEILRRPKAGRTYFVRGPRGIRRHVASAPGETHANLTGKLRRSIGWKVSGDGSQMDFGYGVATTQRTAAPEYAPFVEYGTSRMSARPSLRNAIDRTDSTVEREFHDALRKEFWSAGYQP